MKIQQYFFRHDSDSHRQPQLLAVRKKWGWKGYGLYWAILEMLRESEGYDYIRDYELIAYTLRTNTETIRSIIEDFGLFSLYEEEGVFASERLNENMEMMEERKITHTKSSKKRGNPNFQNGKTNPYYSSDKEEKDNSERLFEIIPTETEINTPLFEDNSPIIEKEKVKVKVKNTTSSSVPSEEVRENSVSTSPSVAAVGKEEAISASPKSGPKTKVASPPKRSKAVKSETLDYSRIVDLYHRLCTDFPRVIKLTDGRKQKIRIRFVEEMHSDWALLEKVFRKMQASKFLRGDSRKGWKASFDWIFENTQNWVKVAEGNYDTPNDATAHSAAPLMINAPESLIAVSTPSNTLPHTSTALNPTPYALHSNPLSASDAFHHQRDQQVLFGLAKAISEL